MPNKKVKYFPYVDNPVFNIEAAQFIPYLRGQGLEVGCGPTGVLKLNIRVDIDKNTFPDICCNCEKLPIKDNQYDHLIAMHILEHLHDPEKALKEWRRVIKYGGLIALVHPDVLFTGKQKPPDENLDKNPFNRHTYEMYLDEFLDWFEKLKNTGLKIVHFAPACPNWSFYILFEKIKI